MRRPHGPALVPTPASVAVAVVIFALICAAPASASPAGALAVGPVLLEDDFDGENGGFTSPETYGYTGWTNWDVLEGTVDLVGNGFHDYQPGNGLYVDLDGFTSGTLASKETFVLEAGEYELAFDLSGSHRTDAENSVTVTLGSAFSEDITLGSDEPFRRIARTIRVADPTSARLVFAHTSLGDTFGLFLDNVRLAGTALGVASVSPPSGGNAGAVSVVVRGAGFEQGAEVVLIDGDDAVRQGRNTLVASRGRIETTLDLRALPAAPLAVEVRNPGGGTARAPQPFVVQEGGQPALWADILGPPRIRLGIPQTYTVRLGNSGDVDAWGAHVFLGIPADVEYRWAGDEEFRSHPHDSVIHALFANLAARSSTSRLLTVRPVVPAAALTLGVGISESHEGIATEAVSSALPTSGPLSRPLRAGGWLTADLRQSALIPSGRGPVPPGSTDYYLVHDRDRRRTEGFWATRLDGNQIAIGFYSGVQILDFDAFRGEYTDANGKTYFVTHVFSYRSEGVPTAEQMRERLKDLLGKPFCAAQPCPKDAFTCVDVNQILKYCPPGEECTKFPDDWTGPRDNVDGWDDLAYWMDKFGERDPDLVIAVMDEVLDAHPVWGNWWRREGRKQWRAEIVASWDPNQKVGPLGSGERRFVGPGLPLSYEIDFENLAAATAPAREVVITDQLDPARVDLATLSLGRIAFAGRDIVPAPGTTELAADVDLRPATDLVVRVRAKLDTGTGLLRWRFAAVEPGTGVPPADPLAGFLPPNRTPPEGEGSVRFTIMPQPGLPTGTEVSNDASIVFDVNPPIDTGEWLNTVDASPPQSSVARLDATQASPAFEVRWAGLDEGSGIRDYTVYVSEDGGPYDRWLRQTAATSATFLGGTGHRYRFHTVATDHAGNVERPPDAPDAVTRVIVPDPTPAAGPTSIVGGGVPGPAGGLSAAELRADLVRDLRSVARRLKRLPMRRIARRRHAVHRFTPLTAGAMAVSWKGQTARAAAPRRTVLLARGRATAPRPGPLTVGVDLTRAGARMIRRGRRLPIVVTATFRPRSIRAVSARTKVTLGQR